MVAQAMPEDEKTASLENVPVQDAEVALAMLEPSAPRAMTDAYLAAESRLSRVAAPAAMRDQSQREYDLVSEMRRLGGIANDTFNQFSARIGRFKSAKNEATTQADRELRTAVAEADRARQAGLERATELENEIKAAVARGQSTIGSKGTISANQWNRFSSTSDSHRAGEANVRTSITSLNGQVGSLGDTVRSIDQTATYPYFKFGAMAGSASLALVFAMFDGWSGFFSGLLFVGPLLGLIGGLVWRQTEQGKLRSSLDSQVGNVQHDVDRSLLSVRHYRDALEQDRTHRIDAAEQNHDRLVTAAEQECSGAIAEARRNYQDSGSLLREQLAQLRQEVHAVAARWDSKSWGTWLPEVELRQLVRLGTMHVFAGLEHGKFIADTLPVIQNVPYGLSMVWRYQGAENAHVPEGALMQILTAIPAGKARFTLLDPVGLGRNVASLMHLAEHDPDLISDRAWVEPRHIEQQLADLSEQMQTIIQKYLKREFETMEEYNQQAGNIEEPYRLLVVNNFPANFTPDALRHLVNIATIGPRCGVYTLIALDDAQKLPHGFVLDDLLNAASMVLAGVPVEVGGATEMAWSIREPKLHSLMVIPDAGPPAELSRQLLDRVGKEAVKNSVVQVPYADLVPDEPSRWWDEKSIDRLRAPIGIFGARKPQMLTLGANEKGDDLFNGVLMVGKPGSGKSNLNHVAIMSLATTYSPEELELYLLDFKQGVEFAVYVKSQLPHARVIAVESEREFALSVLRRLDDELEIRGKLFREATAQVDDTASIATYRQRTGKKLPRIVLLIDEYQELFSEDDALAQTASVVLERLVRLGRAYGIHLVLSTQTLAGNANLNKRTTQGLMTVRIALMSSDADARLILAEDNPEARLLNRPGEAIYNDQAGRLEGNNRFQAAHLPPDERNTYLAALTERAAAEFPDLPAPIVFEGNRSADAEKNRDLGELLDGSADLAAGPKAWIGDPVAIAEPVGPTIRPQAGNNMLVIGQELDLAYGMLGTALAAVARYHELNQNDARLEVVDMGAVDTVHAEVLQRITGAFAGNIEQVSRRRLTDRIESLHQEVERRIALEDEDRFPPRYFVIAGLQRARHLRTEDEYSFTSALDETPQLSPRQQFAKILREGPDVGIHVIAWVDTVGNLFRAIDQRLLSEFDHRVVMQMSADDSFKLIDAKTAVSLGANRAILHSEERGTIEKFRPYGLPSSDWMDRLESRL